MINTGIGKVIASFETKLESLEHRLAIVESENMEKDLKIDQLQERVISQGKAIDDLHDRLEDLDANRRLSSLILTCEDFTTRQANEDIEEMVVQAVSKRYPRLKITTADLNTAHRLQANNKIIVKFLKRWIRDEIFDGRFDMVGGGGRPGSHSGAQAAGRLAPMFVTESLVASRAALYQELLQARKPENGRLIASVFSRRGVVWCRTERGGGGGRNIRVPDEQHLRRILGGARFPPPFGAAAAAGRRPPPPPAGPGAGPAVPDPARTRRDRPAPAHLQRARPVPGGPDRDAGAATSPGRGARPSRAETSDRSPSRPSSESPPSGSAEGGLRP